MGSVTGSVTGEFLDKHQLSTEAGPRWAPGSLPARGLWGRFSERLAEGRHSRKPERKENFVVEALTEAGATAAEWRQEATRRSVRSQALLALKAKQFKRGE